MIVGWSKGEALLFPILLGSSFYYTKLKIISKQAVAELGQAQIKFS